MVALQLGLVTGGDQNWPGAYIGFYSDSGCTTPVVVTDERGVIVSSGKTGSTPVRKIRADWTGTIPPVASAPGSVLTVPSGTATLYCRPESKTGVVVGSETALAVPLIDPSGPPPGGGGSGAVSSVAGRTGVVTLAVADVSGAAPLASPALTGTPTAPTASPGTNTTQVATTAHVQAAVAALINGAPGALDTLKELADAMADDAAFSATVTNALALKAPLASPALTGNPTVPTQTPGDNSTKAASTAFVLANAGSGSSLAPTAVKTSAYTAAASDLVPVNTTSGAVTITLPTAPADKAQVAVKHVIQGATNAVTIACAGSDVFNKSGGGTSLTLPTLNQGILLQYKSSTAIWYVLGDDLSLAQLDARYVVAANAVAWPSNFAAETTTYTALAGDFVLGNGTSAGFTVTLPAAPAVGALVAVKKTDSSAHAITVAAAASGTIDGASTLSVSAQNNAYLLEHVGSNVWNIAAALVAPVALTGAAVVAAFTGTPTGSKFLRDDGTLVTPAGGVSLDTTAAHIASDVVTGTPVAGSQGLAADSAHQHQLVAHDHSTTNKGGTPAASAVVAGFTGTPNGSKFLRDDGTLAVPSGGGSSYAPGQYKLPSGAVAATHDRTLAVMGATTLTSGTSYMAAIELLAGQVVTSLNMRSGATGLVTVTHSWMTLSDASRVRLAVSSDSIADLAGNTSKAFAMGSPFTVVTSGLYYVELMVAAATVNVLCVSTAVQQHTIPPITSGTGGSGSTTPPSVSSTGTALSAVGTPPFIWVT